MLYYFVLFVFTVLTQTKLVAAASEATTVAHFKTVNKLNAVVR